MCEAKPGVRCAADTGGSCQDAAAAYQAAHPNGPALDPLTAGQGAHVPTVAGLLESRDATAIDAYLEGKWAASMRTWEKVSDYNRRYVHPTRSDFERLARRDAPYTQAIKAELDRVTNEYDAQVAAYNAETGDLSELGARRVLLRDGPTATMEKVYAVIERASRGEESWSSAHSYVRELDREVDNGHMATHPWRNPARSAAVADLRSRAAGGDEAAADDLTVLYRRSSLVRAEAAGRRAGEGTPEWNRWQALVVACERVEGNAELRPVDLGGEFRTR